jgi:hypothetical protein
MSERRRIEGVEPETKLPAVRQLGLSEFKSMAHSMMLPAVGAMLLAGVGAGVQLGHSAISEINPIYFEDPPTRFHADLSPYRPSQASPPVMTAETDPLAYGTGCIGCRTYPEEYYPVPDESVNGYAATYPEEVQAASLTSEEAQPGEDSLRLQEAIRRVEQYARGEGPAPAEIVLASAGTDGTDDKAEAEEPFSSERGGQ